jgi:class 3 adenylate cyclase
MRRSTPPPVFCPSCGRGLYEDCPSCGAEARIGARFCASCGARLDAPTAKDEERKLVTVLFADLTGSTALGERLDPLNDEIAERHRVALAVRIGVNSGEVIAGIGAGDQLIVTGDAVNVAARLQQTAEPGDVVAGEPTYLATRGVFRAEPIEDRLLKGKSLPVRAWRVAGMAEPSAGSELAPARSGLVGRARELALLETLYRGSVEEARPQLVTILGHAWIGKSRLSEEFVAAARARTDGTGVYGGRCLPRPWLRRSGSATGATSSGCAR